MMFDRNFDRVIFQLNTITLNIFKTVLNQFAKYEKAITIFLDINIL